MLNHRKESSDSSPVYKAVVCTNRQINAHVIVSKLAQRTHGHDGGLWCHDDGACVGTCQRTDVAERNSAVGQLFHGERRIEASVLQHINLGLYASHVALLHVVDSRDQQPTGGVHSQGYVVMREGAHGVAFEPTVQKWLIRQCYGHRFGYDSREFDLFLAS